MSRMYQVNVTVDNPKQGREPAIAEVLMELWGVEEVVATDIGLVAEANANLSGGITEQEFARELTHRVWQVNQDFCEVAVRMTYLEELPYEDYVFASPDEYQEWLTSGKTQDKGISNE